MERALRFLEYRARSVAEVRQKLGQLRYSPAVIEKILTKLCDNSYLKDETLARIWAQSRAETRGYGPARIDQELTARGIDASVRREVIRQTFPEGIEKETARKFLTRQFGDEKLSDPKILRRAIAFLQRRGYSTAVIADLLGHLVQED